MTAQSTVTTATTADDRKRSRSVGFASADIVEFEPTMHTATVTSGGVPLGMSFKERRRIRRRLDSYEKERSEDRVPRHEYMENGYLEPAERLEILGDAGHKAESIVQVEEEVNKIIEDRMESNEMDIEYMYGIIDDSEDDSDFDEEADEALLALKNGAVMDALPSLDNQQDVNLPLDQVLKEDLANADENPALNI